MTDPYAFYLPEDPDYTVVDSALDSVRFLLHVSERDAGGHLMCRSIDAMSDGSQPAYRGRLIDGVGYCADSVFATQVLVRLGRAIGRPELERAGFSYLEHALTAGFFDEPGFPIVMYRDVESGDFLLNLEARPEYIDVGHVAKVATELLRVAALDTDDARAARCRDIALRTVDWVLSVDRTANGWFPRKCSPDGRVYPFAAEALDPVDLGLVEQRPDPIHDRSGAGTLALQFLVAATAAGLVDARGEIRTAVDTFVSAAGFFGSTNTDTEDPEENVSYAIAFETLLAAGELLDDQATVDAAYELCLRPLTRFELVRDLNGQRTKGLLFMEDAWNAACTWETAQVSHAYLAAYRDTGHRPYVLKALTILRSMALHHHGPFGFLTEAVDWDGHSPTLRHFPGERYGDIATTHPFLNNLQVVLPTVEFLERFAREVKVDDGDYLFDVEGNRLCSMPPPAADWMTP